MTTPFSWRACAADAGTLEHELVGCGADVAALGQLGAHQLDWRPDERTWSVTQCVEHLAESNRQYCDELGRATAARRPPRSPRRFIDPGAPSRWFLDELAPPPRRKLRAPKPIIPRSGSAWAEVAQDYAVHHARVIQLLRNSLELDLNRIRFRNPFFPLLRFTVGVGFLVLVTHDRRHLEQIQGLRERPGFPAGPAG